MFSKLLRPRTLVLIVLLIIVAALTFGFAATMTPAGDDVAAGTSTKMVDMAADVNWTLNTTTPDADPTAALTFTAGTPVNVYAQVQDTNGAAITLTSGSTWVACAGGGANWTCPFVGADVEDIYYIRVAAGE
jgi:hypothetical protein